MKRIKTIGHTSTLYH